MNDSILNTPQKTIMMSLSFALVAVSVFCEVMLFTEQTEALIDTVIAGIVAGCLVCFQFLFAAVTAKYWQNKNILLASMMFFITALLFIISLSATAGFFESRFQESQQASIQNSNDYQLKKAIIDDLTKQEKALTESAKTATQNGNSWYAGQLLEKAGAANEKRQQAITELSEIETPNTDATAALAQTFGAGRWVLWVVFAALVDLCPLIAFSSYAIKKTPSTETEKTPQTPVKQGQTPNKTEAKTPIKTLQTQETFLETPETDPQKRKRS